MSIHLKESTGYAKYQFYIDRSGNNLEFGETSPYNLSFLQASDRNNIDMVRKTRIS